jgi:hypothetical protein
VQGQGRALPTTDQGAVVRPNLIVPSFLVFVARLTVAVKPPVIACAPGRVGPTRRRVAKPEPRGASGKFQRPCAPVSAHPAEPRLRRCAPNEPVEPPESRRGACCPGAARPHRRRGRPAPPLLWGISSNAWRWFRNTVGFLMCTLGHMRFWPRPIRRIRCG